MPNATSAPTPTPSARARLARGPWRALAFIAVVAAVVYFARGEILGAVGRTLLAEDPIAPADVIVVSLDAGGAGVLEAADLVHRGMATRVAVFTDPPRDEDLEFIRRGLPYEDQAARQIRQFQWLKVDGVQTITRRDAGTEGEADVLPSWCDRNEVHSVIVVSSTDHSRRLRRVLNRAMQGHAVTVSIRPSRYSPFDPAQWWKSRSGVRTAIVEMQKLALDVVLHPF